MYVAARLQAQAAKFAGLFVVGSARLLHSLSPLALHSFTRLLPLLHSPFLFSASLSSALCGQHAGEARATQRERVAAASDANADNPTPNLAECLTLLPSDQCTSRRHNCLLLICVCSAANLCNAVSALLQGVSLRLPEAADLQSALSKFIASNYSQDELKVRATSTCTAHRIVQSVL